MPTDRPVGTNMLTAVLAQCQDIAFLQ